MGNDKHLKLRAASTSGLGRVLAHLQKGPTKVQDLASITLQGRFLPFAMDRNEAGFREMAIRCANECEAWAKAIREYAELGIYPTLPAMVKGQDNSSTHDSISEEEVDSEFESDEEVKVDEVDDLGF
ncbi:MAG: hypothetical protein QNJ53_30425 [Pleurocapsa sp. MO_192.B19]|nr:hypothetical protein [Pleurocapsa sp. MO_192.B19]